MTTGVIKSTTPEEARLRKLLRKTLRVLEEFRKLDAEMPLQQIVTLLEVALSEGISVSDLAVKVGQSTSATSRHVGALGDFTRSKTTPAHQLVKAVVSPVDRRFQLVNLTPKGRRVVDSITQAMDKEI